MKRLPKGLSVEDAIELVVDDKFVNEFRVWMSHLPPPKPGERCILCNYKQRERVEEKPSL